MLAVRGYAEIALDNPQNQLKTMCPPDLFETLKLIYRLKTADMIDNSRVRST